MGDHVTVDIRGLVASGQAAVSVPGKEEDDPLIGMVECRICQDEDLAKNLESPCACSGSLKVRVPLLHFKKREHKFRLHTVLLMIFAYDPCC
jgi:hypothetical protein